MVRVPESALTTLLALVTAWLAIGLAGLIRPRSLEFAGRALFVAGAVVGLLLAIVAAMSIALPAESVVLPIGLPDLPVHLRRDALSSVFLFLLGSASVGISLFAAGYFRSGEGTLPGVLCLEYHLFLAAMAMVWGGSTGALEPSILRTSAPTMRRSYIPCGLCYGAVTAL